MMVYKGLLRKTKCPTCNKLMLQNFKEPIFNCYECNYKVVLANKNKSVEIEYKDMTCGFKDLPLVPE